MLRLLLQSIFTVSLIIFMVGNLLTMGLQLRLADAFAPLKHVKFVLATLVGGFIIGPALAYAVVLIVPMERPYATGVLLLGLAPAAPFLPLVVKRANGDLAAAAGLMLLACLGTILIMPLAVPLLTTDLSASAWGIAKPLLVLILLPLAIGIFLKSVWERAAEWLYRYVKGITALGTVVFLAMVLVLNFNALIGSVGSHALLAQLLYVPALSLAGYWIGTGQDQRSALSLGLGTRNIGGAAAIVGPNGDQRIMVMLLIATLVTLAFSFAAASWFARVGMRTPKRGVKVHV